MSEYDFKNLSSIDFEFLIQDLLQKELDITLENFTSGRDNGIDLRYSQGKGAQILVQCKHFPRTPYPTMISQLKSSELSKVQKLNPNRYIFATSFELTPHKKEEIFNILSPFSKTEGDIYGKNDLNSLLRKYPEVERTHFKLWLSSTTVLERITHSAVFNQTYSDIEKIRRKLNYYVQNESYFEALGILKKNNYCIVAGIPGIGKTTLAEVVLLWYLNSDYEGITVNSDISEAFSVFNRSKKQIFLYDDFLGQTSFLEKLNKNEEQNLLRFIETVKQSPNTKFLLTTREYILNQAKQSYEKLDQSKIDVNKCVITLGKYTRFDKAKILYNHLYFSDLRDEYKQNLLADKNYKKIIDHKNYTPRIVEWMTEYFSDFKIKSSEYFEQFIANLDNPFRLWEHAFDNQLSRASQHLLLVLATMTSEVFIEDLEAAFNSYYDKSAKIRNFSTGKYDFKRSLKELESNFIGIEKRSDKLIIQFHNPSIKDFIEYRLSSEPSSVEELGTASIFYDQIVQLWNVGIMDAKKGVKNFSEQITKREFVALQQIFLKKIEETFQNDGCQLEKIYFGNSGNFHMNREFSPEARLDFALDVAEKVFINNEDKIIEYASPLIHVFCVLVSQGKAGFRETLQVVDRLSKSRISSTKIFGELLITVKDTLMSYSPDLYHFNYFLGFRRKFPKVVKVTDFKKMKKKFRTKCIEEIEYYKQIEEGISDDVSSDDVTSTIDEISIAAPHFGFNFDEELEDLREIVKELEEAELEKRSSDYSDYNDTRGATAVYGEKDIESLFDSLRSDFQTNLQI